MFYCSTWSGPRSGAESSWRLRIRSRSRDPAAPPHSAPAPPDPVPFSRSSRSPAFRAGPAGSSPALRIAPSPRSSPVRRIAFRAADGAAAAGSSFPRRFSGSFGRGSPKTAIQPPARQTSARGRSSSPRGSMGAYGDRGAHAPANPLYRPRSRAAGSRPIPAPSPPSAAVAALVLAGRSRLAVPDLSLPRPYRSSPLPPSFAVATCSCFPCRASSPGKIP